MRRYGLLGGGGGGGGASMYPCAKHVANGVWGNAPLGNLDFGPFIRCNLGLFSHKIAIE